MRVSLVSLLVNKVICAFLLDVVGMSEQPDDFITSERESHEDKKGLEEKKVKKKKGRKDSVRVAVWACTDSYYS